MCFLLNVLTKELVEPAQERIAPHELAGSAVQLAPCILM